MQHIHDSRSVGRSVGRPRPAGLVAAVALVLVAGACGKVSEDNLDKWMNTQQGPGKIEAAMKDSDVPTRLRARAARNMIRMDKWAQVRAWLDEDTSEDVRKPLVGALVPMLWDDAKLADKLQVPGPIQSNAKDALFELRAYADDDTRNTIDGYLVEWLTGYYEGRSKTGRIGGHTIVRAIGPRAADGLLSEARAIVAAPPTKDGGHVRFGDNLLYGLALSGSPKAVGFVLDLAASESPDKSLQDRAMAALFNAYIKPVGVDPADPAGLKPHLDRLTAMIKNPDLPGAERNDAIQLVAAMGMPECLPVFVDMVSYPAQAQSFRWIGVQQGIRCGKIDAIVPVAEAIPPGDSYAREILQKYLWDEVLKLSPRAEIAERAAGLLSSESPIARVSGIELLGQVKLRGRAAQDAEKIKKLAGDTHKLKGWWGKGKDAAGKPDPTIGSLAASVAAELAESGR